SVPAPWTAVASLVAVRKFEVSPAEPSEMAVNDPSALLSLILVGVADGLPALSTRSARTFVGVSGSLVLALIAATKSSIDAAALASIETPLTVNLPGVGWSVRPEVARLAAELKVESPIPAPPTRRV